VARLSHVYAGPSCPHCHTALPADRRPGRIRCGVCWRDFEAAVFTPPAAEVRVSRVAEAGPDGVTPCADHPGNAAVSECARCGVFMCGLCRIDSDGQALCPACYERLSGEGALASARTSYRDFRGMAVKLAAIGLAILFIGPLCGPGAMFCAWKARQQKIEWGDEDGYGSVWAAMAVGAFDIVAGSALIVAVARG
jgi:hypothetical protein